MARADLSQPRPGRRGVVAAHTTAPVLGAPIQSKALNGMDSLLSTVQMPKGIPVATLAIGDAGASNAALFAVSILATKRPELREKLQEFRREQSEKDQDADLVNDRKMRVPVRHCFTRTVQNICPDHTTTNCETA